MFVKRVVTYLIVFCFVCTPLQDLQAKRKETMNDPGAANIIILALGGIATGVVFQLIYNKISGKQPRAHKPSRSANNANLLVSGDFGRRFFLIGEDAGKLAPGTPAGLSLRYQWRTGKWNISSVGLLYRMAEHDGRESAEGAHFKMAKLAFTLGLYERSQKATWDYDWGLGVVLNEVSDQDGRDNNGALMINVGTGLGIRVGERVTIGPRIEFSNWLSRSGYYYLQERYLLSAEVLLQCTVSLF